MPVEVDRVVHLNLIVGQVRRLENVRRDEARKVEFGLSVRVLFEQPAEEWNPAESGNAVCRPE